MSWQIRMIEFGLNVNGHSLRVGDMFYADLEQWQQDEGYLPWPLQYAKPNRLSEFYKRTNSHRLPLIVCLPGRVVFCIDGACWRTPIMGGGVEYYGGWNVLGTAPNITLNPSVNVSGMYHGWIEDGIISDDCEGRKFDPVTGHLLCKN